MKTNYNSSRREIKRMKRVINRIKGILVDMGFEFMYQETFATGIILDYYASNPEKFQELLKRLPELKGEYDKGIKDIPDKIIIEDCDCVIKNIFDGSLQLCYTNPEYFTKMVDKDELEDVL